MYSEIWSITIFIDSLAKFSKSLSNIKESDIMNSNIANLRIQLIICPAEDNITESLIYYSNFSLSVEKYFKPPIYFL